MKKIIYIPLACMLFALVYSCSKNELEFKKYLGDKEVVYTGKVGKVTIQPGNLRVGLVWKSSTDPSITGYVVYWNNNADSQVVKITTKTDSVRTIIEGLDEYVYSFTIYSYDAKGNRSVSTEVNNAKVYGPNYASVLLNRAYKVEQPYVINDDGSVLLNFTNNDTIHAKTVIKYTNVAGVASEVIIRGTDSVAKLPSYKPGEKVTYQSSYIPERTSIDTFTVDGFAEYPEVFRLVECTKSLFADMSPVSPFDAGPYDGGHPGTRVERLWDGTVGAQDYPNIWHSGGYTLPQQLTFDMGKLYGNLYQVEETGRTQAHNPDKFEVWGIDVYAGHETTLRPTDAGWKDEMIAKGWTLLVDAIRGDNGNNPMKFLLNNGGKQMRYIRLRLKHTANNEGSYTNMSEVTFWNKQ
jgi:hypothetical protein